MTPNLYIRESCDYQGAIEPENYVGMALAYMYVSQMSGPLFAADIKHVASLVVDKMVGYRRNSIFVINNPKVMDPSIIDGDMRDLLARQEEVSPAEFYFEFMDIFPFADGNGEVASLLFNYLNDSLSNPIHPPEFDTLPLCSGE